MQTTIYQYGKMMRQQGVLWPAPIVRADDVVQPQVTVYRIGQRIPVTSAFVFERKGWATVYVDPGYSGYRDVFCRVMPDVFVARQVDHLYPKSKAAAGDYLALGRIDPGPNITWNDRNSPQAMSQKILNGLRSSPPQLHVESDRYGARLGRSHLLHPSGWRTETYRDDTPHPRGGTSRFRLIPHA